MPDREAENKKIVEIISKIALDDEEEQQRLIRLTRKFNDKYKFTEHICNGSVRMQVFPAIWGAAEFTDLTTQLEDELQKYSTGDGSPCNVHEPTRDFHIFSWIFENIPTIGLFPLYLVEDRKENWAVRKFAVQRRVAISMNRATALRVARGVAAAGALRETTKTLQLSRDIFEKIVTGLANKSRDLHATFYHFGLGHAAQQILTEALKDLDAKQYYLNNMNYFKEIPRVLVKEIMSVLEICKQQKLEISHPDLSAEIDKLVIRRNFKNLFKEKSLEMMVDGLRSHLGEDAHHSHRASFVISDLGVEHFLALKGPSDIITWEVQHEQEVPVGIGFSIPG